MSSQDEISAERSFESPDAVANGSSRGRREFGEREDEPAAERQSGPSGIALVGATVAMFAFVGAIFLLLGVGGSAATGGAIAVMVLGLVVVSRYVQRISWTRSSPTDARPGLIAVSDGPSVGGEDDGELSPYDFPRENPARQQLEREAA